MLRWFVAVLVLIQCDSNVNKVCSRNVLFTHDIVRLFEKDSKTNLNRYRKETSVHFNIGLKETVCFKVTDENGVEKIYYLGFEEAQSIFTYKNSYNFAVAAPNVTCVCDCPGLEDHCSPNRDSCKEDGRKHDQTCYNFYKDNEVSNGCGLFGPMGNSEICCSVSFNAYDNQKFTAFEISTPITRGTFDFTVLRLNSATEPSVKYFSADLDKGGKIFIHDVTVSFETPGKIIPIPDGWYFGKKETSEVLTNVKINGLNEWSINRLGWLKYDNKGELQYIPTEVKPVFTAEAIDCKENRVNVKFSSDYSHREIEEAKRLEEYYASTVHTVEREDIKRDMFVTFRQFDRMKVMLTFPGENDVVQHYSEPKFDDFEGKAVLDKHSNRVLNITIFNGKGTIYGTMKVGGSPVETFDFTIDTDNAIPRDYNNYVQITQWCSNSGKTELCFHDGNNQIEKCKQIFCESEANSKFEVPPSAIDYISGRKESLSEGWVWKKYTNPVEWFNGITGLQEAVCMVTVVGLVVLLIAVIVLIFKYTNSNKYCARQCLLCPCWSKGIRDRMEEVVTESPSNSYSSYPTNSSSFDSTKLNIFQRMKYKLRKKSSKQDHYDSHSSAFSNSHNHDAIPKISESEVSDSFSESDYYDSGYENRH